MAHNYIVTAHQPSVVEAATVGSFTGPRDRNLILSKVTYLEVYTLTEEGLQFTVEINIYGRIVAMALYKPRDSPRTLLLVATAKLRLCVLYYEAGQIKTLTTGDTADLHSSLSCSGTFLAVDPECRAVLLYQYERFLRFIPLRPNGDMLPSFNMRTEEARISDIQAVHGCEQPTVAVLYADHKDNMHVRLLAAPTDSGDVLMQARDGPWTLSNVGAATKLIPIPGSHAGVVILGQSVISYCEMHNGEQKVVTIQIEQAIFRAHDLIDPDGRRILLGDDRGGLHLLTLDRTSTPGAPSLSLMRLGETVTASTISYLDNGFVFVGSRSGDSQLVQLGGDADAASRVRVVDAFPSLGQAVNFVVVDPERQGQGQGQIVACCGSGKDGSLRVIRNGVGINELAFLEMGGLKGVWALTAGSADGLHRLLVTSFINATRVLSIATESPEEVLMPGLSANESTLHFADAAGGRLVQVTATAALLLDGTTGALLSRWAPESGSVFSVASSNAHQVVVCSNADIALLDIRGDSLVLAAQVRLDNEIACINITPVGAGGADGRARYAAVGMWGDMTLRLLRLPSLEQVVRQELPRAQAIPRSVQLCDLEGVSYVMCGLGDGHFYSAAFQENNEQLPDIRRVTLGTRPISLTLFQRPDGTHFVFAASDRSSVIHSSHHKLLYSTVTLKEANYVCQVNSPFFENCIAAAGAGGITIGTIDQAQKLHIRTVPLRETPRRVGHHEGAGAYAVASIAHARGPGDMDRGFVRLFDDQTFDELDSFALGEYELPASLTLASLGLGGEDSDAFVPFIVVGVASVLPHEDEPTTGRVIVLSAAGRRLRKVAEYELSGAPWDMKPLGDELVTSEGHKLRVLRLSASAQGALSLGVAAEAEQLRRIVPARLSTHGNLVLVGDLMHNAVLLRYRADGVLEEVARAPSTLPVMEVAIVDDDTVLLSDDAFNLLCMTRNHDSDSAQDRAELHVAGEVHLGEMINTIRPGSLVLRVPEQEATTYPSHIYMTPDGSLGLIVALPENVFTLLKRVEVNMRNIIKGVGALDHAAFRGYYGRDRRAPDSKGFVDGDLVETFLEISPELQRAVVAGENGGAPIPATVEHITRVIEDMYRLHS